MLTSILLIFPVVCLAMNNDNSKLGDALRNNTYSNFNSTNNSQDQDENLLKAEARKYLGECGGENVYSSFENSYENGYSNNNKNRNNRGSNSQRNRNRQNNNNYGGTGSDDNGGNYGSYGNRNRNDNRRRNNDRRNSNNDNSSNESIEDNDNSNRPYNNNNNNNRDRNTGYGYNSYGGTNGGSNGGYSGSNSGYSGSNVGYGSTSGSYGGYNSNYGGSVPGYMNGGYGNSNGYSGSNGYGNRRDNCDEGGYNGFKNSGGYGFNSMIPSTFRTRRNNYNDDSQCISQCVFGNLEVLDENRVPSETLTIKWLQEHYYSNDLKRIRALREARRCFARLSTSDIEDGCEFASSLSKCLNLELE